MTDICSAVARGKTLQRYVLQSLASAKGLSTFCPVWLGLGPPPPPFAPCQSGFQSTFTSTPGSATICRQMCCPCGVLRAHRQAISLSSGKRRGAEGRGLVRTWPPRRRTVAGQPRAAPNPCPTKHTRLMMSTSLFKKRKLSTACRELGAHVWRPPSSGGRAKIAHGIARTYSPRFGVPPLPPNSRSSQRCSSSGRACASCTRGQGFDRRSSQK